MATPKIILVVDDERPVAESVTQMLTLEDFAVLIPPFPLTIEDVLSLPFDVLLTDLVMPRISGWELIQAVRAARPLVPIIAFTGHALRIPAKASDLLNEISGANALLGKPFRAHELISTINKWLLVPCDQS